MDSFISTTEAPTNNQTWISGEGNALVTFLLWFVLILSIIIIAESGASIWCLCIQKDWKPQSTCLLNLAVAELLSLVFGSLLPALHEIAPTVFSFTPWIAETATLVSSLGYNSSVFFLISISTEQTLTLLWKGLLKHLQTKHYSVLCALLWVLAFLLTAMEYAFCIQDTETDATLGELTESYERRCQSLLCLLSTLDLVECIQFMVMCGLVIFKKFQQHRQKPFSKLYAVIFVVGLFTSLALAIVLWAEDYAFEIFNEIIAGIFFISCNYIQTDWKFKQHFRNLWQKLACNISQVKQERGDGTVSTEV